MKSSESRLTHRRPLAGSNQLSKQAGLTLLEVIISLSIIASATVGLNAIADRFSADTKNTLTASQVRTFGEAAKAYIKDNYAAVQAVATATTPALIDVPTLIAAGKLTTGFLATNAFGQSMCALVLQPTANRLQAMVVAEGGTAIDDLFLGGIAAVIGGSGGGVYSSDATVIRGAIGGWSISTSTFDNLVNNVSKKCDGTAGNVRLTAGHPMMALWFENGDTSSAFLARDAVPGRPELNEMNTPLVMNSVAVSNAACTRAGAIARDATGAVLSCQSSVWKTQGSAFWKDPVASFAALPACAAASSGQTRIVSTPSVGSGPRAYTCDGASWIALAVDNSGNITIPGIATSGKVALTDVVSQGSACSNPSGSVLVARDASGLILSCQSGVWAKATPVPSFYRYTFTSSTTWTVPANVKSAYVSIAGGGSGAYEGFPRLISGASGGNLSSYPVNLTAGESISITVGLGGFANGTGGTTQFGNYVTCTGGTPSNGGTLAYAGNCGVLGGTGNNGQFLGVGNPNSNTADYGGHLSGGVTSIGFGSGGYANMSWSAPNSGIFGYSSAGFNGAVFVDVLY